MNLKPFDEGDWWSYSGAEGDNPKIAYEDVTLDGEPYSACVIADEAGINIDLWTGDQNSSGDYYGFYVLEHGEDQPGCEAIVNGIDWNKLTNDGLLALGFTFVSA